jgi:hypothetical protein
MSGRRALLLLLSFRWCQTESPPEATPPDARKLSAHSPDAGACGADAGVEEIGLGRGSGSLGWPEPRSALDVGHFSLGEYTRPPFNLSTRDLCVLERAGNRASLDCLLSPAFEGEFDLRRNISSPQEIFDPLRLLPIHFSFLLDGRELRVGNDVDQAPRAAPILALERSCWDVETKEEGWDTLTAATVGMVARTALAGSCPLDGGAPRKVPAELDCRPRSRPAGGTTNVISLSAPTIGLNAKLGELGDLHRCSFRLSPSADAVSLRCFDPEEVGLFEFRAYAVPGKLWFADYEKGHEERIHEVPCDARVTFVRGAGCPPTEPR